MLPEDKDAPQPKPDFDFIMKDQPKARRRFGLPPIRGLMLVIVVGALLTTAIVIYGLVSGRGDNSPKLYSLISQGSEISRVSAEIATEATDSDTRNLAMTTTVSLASQQKQFKDYLTKKSGKFDSKQLVPASSDIDQRLEAAVKSNTYDQTYLSFLKSSVEAYRQSLSKVYNSAGDELKSVLSEAYQSTAKILESSDFSPKPAS